jgi:hypothetical protein
MGDLLRQILVDVPELDPQEDDAVFERVIFYDRDFRRVEGYCSDSQTVEKVFPDLFCRVMVVNQNLSALVVSAVNWPGTWQWPWVMDAEMEAFAEEACLERQEGESLRAEREALITEECRQYMARMRLGTQ